MLFASGQKARCVRHDTGLHIVMLCREGEALDGIFRELIGPRRAGRLG